MNTLVLGASGKTGSLVVNQALAAGHDVTAFVRDPAKLQISHARLSIAQGDARSKDDLAKALQGKDSVVSALGRVKGEEHPILLSTKALIDSARETGVKRIIFMSSHMVTPNFKPNLLGMLLQRILKGMIADKTAGEKLLRASDLDWTLVHPTQLTDGPRTGNVRNVGTGESVGMKNKISRADVAEFLVKELESGADVHQSVVITAT